MLEYNRKDKFDIIDFDNPIGSEITDGVLLF